MTMTPGDGGGGGSTGFNCRISAADEVAIIENLLDRIRDLETKVARLQAKPVTYNPQTTYLDELGQRVGWVTGVTYMGVPGWTRTEGGTLIPPPGVTFASLGILPQPINGRAVPEQDSLAMILKDRLGNILFGFNADDGLYGDKVDEWDAAATGSPMDYGALWWSNGGVIGSAGSFSNSLRGGVTVSSQAQYELAFRVTQAGLYGVHATINIYKPSDIADCVLYINNGLNTTTLNGLYTRATAGAAGQITTLTVSGVVERAAYDYIRASRSGNAGIQTYTTFSFHIVRLSA